MKEEKGQEQRIRELEDRIKKVEKTVNRLIDYIKEKDNIDSGWNGFPHKI